VASLDWETVRAVLDCRFSSGISAEIEAAKLRRQYAELTVDEARRLLRLWMVRAVAPVPKPH
jgi:hypothetical protein